VDETQSDAAALGIVMPEQPPEDFEVWEENWPVVEMFLRVQTQWRTTMSGVLGLDYGAVAWLFKMYAVEDPRALLEDLQIMEAAAMLVINSRSS
jgi:ABC-type thiamine transport system substrate-binding protein